QYAHYEVLFDSVSGLSEAAGVNYNGLPVGQVVSLEIDPQNTSKIRVRIQVDADTPVKTDTVAKLQSLGVTGVSTVALSGGTAAAAILPEGGQIRAERSAIQSVLEGAPELLEKAIVLLENVNEVVNDKNRAAVTNILDNLDSASGRLNGTLKDFESLSADLGHAAREVAGFADRLGALSNTAETTLTTATKTLTSAQDAIDRSKDAINTAKGTLETVDATFSSAKTLMEGDLSTFIRQGTATATTLETATQRLEPSALAALDSAHSALDEAEETFATVNRLVDEDVDAIVADVRRAVKTFTTTIESASGDIDTISAEVLMASKSASNFVGTLDDIVVQNRRQVSDFLR
ncbi:MAG: MlaD family protein, partial [Roseibium sp.]